MRALLAIGIVGFLLYGTAPAQQRATPDPIRPNDGVGERLGESVDRGLSNLGEKLRKGWADIRKSVDELGVQGRVYGRLHWDKALANAPVEISVQDENIVTLSGTVADEAARMSAVKLAQDTVGVSRVVDHLTISSTTITTVPSTTTTLPPAPLAPPPAVPQQ